MRTRLRNAIIIASVGVVFTVGLTVALVAGLPKKCVGEMCKQRHVCTTTGECVPDPTGPFTGPTCKCWSCTGNGPGPESKCEVGNRLGMYATEKECFEDTDKMCGWMWQSAC